MHRWMSSVTLTFIERTGDAMQANPIHSGMKPLCKNYKPTELLQVPKGAPMMIYKRG